MSREITKGATSQAVYFDILDSTSTTGGRKTGLAFNTASLVGYYVRNGGSATAITLATLAAANSAWSSGGFKEVDATNMPGVYRLDVPDAAFAAGSGDSVVVTLKGATGMAQVSRDIQLIAHNNQDSVRLGLTALPNAAAEAAGGLYTRGSGAGQIGQAVNGQADMNVVDWKGATAPAMTGDAYARLGAPAGASVSADVAAIKSDTGTTLTDVNSGAGAIYTRLGAPAGASIAADIAAAKVDTAAVKVVTDQLVAVQAEPTGAPTVNPTPLVKIARIYQALRNKVTVTASAKTFFDDSAGALWSKSLSDDGTTYSEAEGA